MTTTHSTEDDDVKTYVVTVPKLKVGKVEYKATYSTGKTSIYTYEGELNDDDQPHGKGTVNTHFGKIFTLEFRNGTPLVGCKISYVEQGVMKFEGELIDLNLDSAGHSTGDGWTIKGTALFPKIFGSFKGTMLTNYTFIDGVFETALVSVKIRMDKSSLIDGNYTPRTFRLIVSDLYEKRTYYKVDELMFFNQNGITYVFSVNESSFIKELHLNGSVNKLLPISSLLIKETIYNCHLDNYVSDEQLTKMAGF